MKRKILKIILSSIPMLGVLSLIFQKHYDGYYLTIAEIVLNIAIFFFSFMIALILGVFEKDDSPKENKKGSISTILFGGIHLLIVSLFIIGLIIGLHSFITKYSYDSFGMIIILPLFEFLGILLFKYTMDGFTGLKKSKSKDNDVRLSDFIIGLAVISLLLIFIIGILMGFNLIPDNYFELAKTSLKVLIMIFFLFPFVYIVVLIIEAIIELIQKKK